MGGKKMKKYMLISAGIIFLLICTSFVSSRNIVKNDYNQNKMFSCNHKGILLSDSLYEITLSNPSYATDICEKSDEDRVFLSGGACSDDYIIYSCEYSTGTLYAIDILTCEMWSIGGGGTGISALAYDQETDILYGSTSINYLYSINPETGEQEQIGPFGNGVQYMIGLAFDSYGTLYGWDIGNDKLWTIDTESGWATEIGSLGFSLNYGYDGDFCKEDDILYIPAYTTSGTLYECDKATGFCSPVGGLPGGIDVDALVIPLDYPPVNYPPYKPYNPRPMNGSSGVVSFPWFTCDTGDPDGDELSYDFYWGYTNPPPKVISNGSTLKYDPPGDWLIFNTTIFLIPALWLLSYGIIAYSFSYFTSYEHKIEGILFLIIGSIAAFTADYQALYCLAIGFGGINLGFGIVRAIKYRKII